MSLIDEVKKLRGLEQQATPGRWIPNKLDVGDDDPIILPAEITSEKRTIVSFEGGMVPLDEDWNGDEVIGNAELLCSMRNLAPAMLAALSMIQEGDAEELRFIAWLLEKDYIEEKFPHRDFDKLRDTIQRLQQMAALMEKEEQG